MKVGFIGAGKVGFSLGKFFVQGNIPVSGYWSRHQESAYEAALFTNTKHYENLQALVQDSDALFLTVPDSAICSIFQILQDFDISEKHICHCSGVMTANEAFPNIQQTGAYGYSIHPLFPINSKYDSYKELANACFCIEGTGPIFQCGKTKSHHLEPRFRSFQEKLKPAIMPLVRLRATLCVP